MRRAAIYCSIMDLLVALLLEQIPDDKKCKVVMEQIKIMAKALRKGLTSAVAAASNLQLIRCDVALSQLKLIDDHVTKARMAPIHGKDLLGPNMTEFDQKIFDTRNQHSLHCGLTTHFKIPNKPAPKSAAVAKTVHQCLGPPREPRWPSVLLEQPGTTR